MYAILPTHQGIMWNVLSSSAALKGACKCAIDADIDPNEAVSGDVYTYHGTSDFSAHMHGRGPVTDYHTESSGMQCYSKDSSTYPPPATPFPTKAPTKAPNPVTYSPVALPYTFIG